MDWRKSLWKDIVTVSDLVMDRSCRCERVVLQGWRWWKRRVFVCQTKGTCLVLLSGGGGCAGSS